MNSELRELKRRLETLGHVYPSGARHQWGFIVYRTVYPARDDGSSQGPLAPEDPTSHQGQKSPAPDWDSLWQALISTMYARTRASVLSPITDTRLRNEPAAAGNEEWINACQELASLFHLEVKDDRAVLEGKTMQEVREMAQRERAAKRAAADAALERVREAKKAAADVALERAGDDPDEREYGEIMSYAYAFQTHVFLYVDEQVLLQFRDNRGTDSEPWIKVVEVEYDPSEHRGNKRYGPQHYFGAMAAEVRRLKSLWSNLEGQSLSNVAIPLRVPVNEDGELGDEAVVPIPVWYCTGGPGNGQLGVRARVSLRDGSLEFL